MGHDPVQLVLEKLDGVQPAGEGRWKARCPAHDDRRPSLSIARGGDGCALVRCHGGCELAAVLRAIGLEMRHLFTGPSGNGKTAKPSGKGQHPKNVYAEPHLAVAVLERRLGGHAAQWHYHDASGQLAGVVVRWNLPDGSKDIRPISRCQGGWAVQAMATPRPLYRLPELLVTQTTVYVVEGEKCADTATAIGLTSTTCAGGAQAPKQSDWTPLAGRDVVILPDADAPGEKYAQAVARLLRKLNPPALVRVVELPGLGEREDVFDFAARHRGNGKTDEQIREAIEELAAATPPVGAAGDEPRRTTGSGPRPAAHHDHHRGARGQRPGQRRAR